ncbi:Ig-like domain-containing protein [Clostridium sporogenes]|uniref:Ig-like domain-containing protein n=1 Tax=Clostridium sporogenes TaxID=1509 RepID=UPI00313B8EE0
MRGYDEVFKITDLKTGYHNIKRLGFNKNMSGSPIVQDSIKVRVCERNTFPTKSNVPVNKTFTINFNRPVKIDSSTKNFVKVLDSNDREVPISIGLGSNPNYLEIHAPSNNYLPNSNYTLQVHPGLKATDGKELFISTIMNFSTSNSSRSFNNSRSLLLKSTYTSKKTPDLTINFD